MDFLACGFRCAWANSASSAMAWPDTGKKAREGDVLALLCGAEREENSTGSIQYAHDPANIALALNEAPLLITMLVDPRGVVHATHGVLPVQSMRIPADQYMPSLQAISVTFLSAPVLNTPGKLDLPVPAEPGYAWSWLERNPDSPDWNERKDITDPRPEATFNGRPQAHEGWLRIKKSSTMEKEQ